MHAPGGLLAAFVRLFGGWKTLSLSSSSSVYLETKKQEKRTVVICEEYKQCIPKVIKAEMAFTTALKN